MNKGSFREVTRLTGHRDAVIVHADDSWYSHVLSGACGFFEKLGVALSAEGIEPLIVRDKDLRSLALLENDCRHIMMGPKRHQGPNIHHAHPAYIRNYWYLDPTGYFWNSSLAEAPFDPDEISAEDADRFFASVSRRMTGRNLSKRGQVERVAGGLGRADVFIPAQDIEKYRDRVDYLSTEEMIETTAATVGRVLVKLHPLSKTARQAHLRAVCERFANVEIIDASIHDLIAAADMVVTQNSAVGFEAFMQEKPVLTCARCDYHHITLVCDTSETLAAHLRDAPGLAASIPFRKYFFWFLDLNMLKPQDEDFVRRAFARLSLPVPGYWPI